MGIILVDLDAILLRTLSENLTTLGYRVESTDSGRSAMDWLSRAVHSVVIAGDELADMSGLEFCRDMRSDVRTHGHYLILSPRRRLEPPGNDLARPDAVLPKPFTMAQLIAALLVAERRMNLPGIIAA